MDMSISMCRRRRHRYPHGSTGGTVTSKNDGLGNYSARVVRVGNASGIALDGISDVRRRPPHRPDCVGYGLTGWDSSC